MWKCKEAGMLSKENVNGKLLRREFMEMTMASTVLAGAAVAGAEDVKPPELSRKIKLGVVGCGSRGHWITGLFKAHGGYEISAVADYFPDAVKRSGDAFGVDESRRFTGLSGYKKMIDAGVEAIVIIDVPCFYPEQARDAVDAGVHVYMAKPYAVDVPGCLMHQASAKKAGEKKLCFLIDYQLPTDKANIEVRDRMHDGGVEGLSYIYSGGRSGVWGDPPKGPTIENLLRGEQWLSSVNLGGDNVVSYDIHIIDGVIWIMGKPPVSACGCSRVTRSGANSDRTDCGGVVFQYKDGTIWTHLTQALNNNASIHNLGAEFMGLTATAMINYWGAAKVHGGPKHFVGKTSGGIYDEGAKANVAEFYRCVTQGDFSNPTAQRAFDGTITAILGREAMAGRKMMTMDELIRENRKLEVDIKGLKV